jgi:hypothetical protein
MKPAKPGSTGPRRARTERMSPVNTPRTRTPSPAALCGAWLAAERAGGHAEAEARLARAFALVPRVEPTSGFAERVLLAAGLSVETPLFGAAAGWLGRLAVLVTVAAFASGLLLLVPALPPLVAALDPALRVASLGGLLADAGRLFAFVARWWDAFAGFAHGVTVAARTPLGMWVLALSVLTALGALRLLFSLAAERSTSHAPARFA